MTTMARISLDISVTRANYVAVLDGVKTLFATGAVFSVQMAEPAEPEPVTAPANDAAPKAGRKGSRKAAEAAPPVDEAPVADEPAPPPVEEPQPEVTASEMWEEEPAPAPEPAPAATPPLTLEFMTDKLNAFAKIHGVATTRKTIQSFGVTRLSELEQDRWSELLAKLKADNGGKPV